MAQREAEAFGPLLRRIRDELDCAILVVEHDMPLLMGLCDRLYAMDLGRVIASGTPEEIRADPAVIASYLGTDQVAITRSGRRTAAPGAAGHPEEGAWRPGPMPPVDRPAPRSSRREEQARRLSHRACHFRPGTRCRARMAAVITRA